MQISVAAWYGHQLASQPDQWTIHLSRSEVEELATHLKPSLLAFGEEGLRRFDELNAQHNKEIVWSDGRHRGFIRLHLDRAGAHADFVAVSDVESLQYSTTTIHSVDIVKRDGQLHYEERGS